MLFPPLFSLWICVNLALQQSGISCACETFIKFSSSIFKELSDSGSLAIITYQGTMHFINQTKKIFLSQIRTRRQVGAASLQSFVRAQSTDAQPKKRPIYVAATEQHVGKTTTCLALISGLKKRFPHSIGYMKPVGQQ